MSRHYGNGYAAAITSPPNAAATSITPASVAGAPATPFDARIRNATLTGDGLHFTKEELVSVTDVTAGVCTIARASEAIHDGSQAAVDFTGGPAIVEHVVTAGAVAEINAAHTVRHAAGVPTGAPVAPELPIAFNSTAVSGGLYFWDGAAWVKGSTIP